MKNRMHGAVRKRRTRRSLMFGASLGVVAAALSIAAPKAAYASACTQVIAGGVDTWTCGPAGNPYPTGVSVTDTVNDLTIVIDPGAFIDSSGSGVTAFTAAGQNNIYLHGNVTAGLGFGVTAGSATGAIYVATDAGTVVSSPFGPGIVAYTTAATSNDITIELRGDVGTAANPVGTGGVYALILDPGSSGAIRILGGGAIHAGHYFGPGVYALNYGSGDVEVEVGDVDSRIGVVAAALGGGNVSVTTGSASNIYAFSLGGSVQVFNEGQSGGIIVKDFGSGSYVRNDGVVDGGWAIIGYGEPVTVENHGDIKGPVFLTPGSTIDNRGQWDASYTSFIPGGVVDSSGTLTARGATTIVGLTTFNNSGLVDLRGTSVLTLGTGGSAAWNASGNSTLQVGAYLTAPLATGALHVGIANGATTVVLYDLVPAAGSAIDLIGVPVVTTMGGSATFDMAPYHKGFVDYELVDQGMTWKLVALPSQDLFEMVKAPALAQDFWRKTGDVWSGRQEEIRDSNRQPGWETWARTFGGAVNDADPVKTFVVEGQSFAANLGINEDFRGFQMGRDVLTPGGQVLLGITSGYLIEEGRFRALDPTTGSGGPAVHNGASLTGWNLGVYGGWTSHGLFVNGLFKDDWLTTDLNMVSAGSRRDIRVSSRGAKVEAGARLGGPGLFVEPVADLDWVSTHLGAATVADDLFRWSDASTFKGELGARVGGDWGPVKSFAGLYAVDRWGSKTRMAMLTGCPSCLSIENDVSSGAYGKADVGLTVINWHGLEAYLKGEALFGGHTQGYSGNLGLRWRWQSRSEDGDAAPRFSDWAGDWSLGADGPPDSAPGRPDGGFSLSREDLDRAGYATFPEALQQLTASGGGPNAQYNNGGDGSSRVDLRNLGSDRNLVLVDGLRWVGTDVGDSVDLATIPDGMVERVEVEPWGGGGVRYGSGAMAGVINVITRDHQKGLRLSAQGGAFDVGDGYVGRYDASWGYDAGATRFVIGAGYLDREPVLAGDRALTRFNAPYGTVCGGNASGGGVVGCSTGTPLGRFELVDPAGILPDPGTPLLTLKAALAPGQVASFNFADPTGPLSSFREFKNPEDLYNFQAANYDVTAQRRASAYAEAVHDFGESLSLRLRGAYVHSRSAQQLAPDIFFGGQTGIFPDLTNPYNPFGPYSADVRRRMVELGPRQFREDVDTWNAAATLSGKADLFEHPFTWNVSAVWSQSHDDTLSKNGLNLEHIAQALGPVSACNSPCVPLNVFGGPGTITPAMAAFIRFDGKDASEQTLEDLSANLAGDLLTLPTGPVKLSAGVEHRRTTGYIHPDLVVLSGITTLNAPSPVSGAIAVDEAYARVDAPLVRDFTDLDLGVGGRWYDISHGSSGAVFNVDLTWRPTDRLTLTASSDRGYRIPSIEERFGSDIGFPLLDDPCSDILGLFGGSPAAPNVAANCIAHGVPPDGSYFAPPQMETIRNGSPRLKPEQSIAYSARLGWSPAFLDRRPWVSEGRVEIAYTDLQVTDIPQRMPPGVLLDQCAQSGACTGISWDPIGGPTIDYPLTNFGGVRTKTLDVNALYRSPDTRLGRFTVRSSTTFLLYFTQLLPAGAGLQQVGRIGPDPWDLGAQGLPQVRSVLSADWERGRLGATVTTRFTSAVPEIASVPAGDVRHVMRSYTVVDAQFRWTAPIFGDRVTFAAGVLNLFNQDPPGCLTCGQGPYDPNLAYAPGRFLYLRMSYKQ